MNITLQTLKFAETPALRSFVEEKVGKLAQLNDRLIRVDVTLKTDSMHDTENKCCELYVSLPGDNKFAKRNAATYEESILKTVEVMEKILRRMKD